ncbi:tethering complex subunit [Thecaphora frezii]
MMLDDFIQSSYQPSSSRNPHAFGAGPTADAADQWATSPNARTAAPLYHPFDGGYENDAAHQHAAALAPNDAAYLTTNTLLDPVAALETGFISSDLDPSTAATPIFQLGRVQYAFNAPLALMTVSSNILTMCLFAYPSSSNGAAPSNPFPTAPPRLVRINLDDPERTEEADVPIPPAPRANRNQPSHDPTTVGPHKMFADPSGRHLILTMRNGDCYYWTSGWKKARILNKLKGIAVESVAWNKLADPAHPSSSANAQRGRRAGGGGGAAVASTREILVGTRSGDIYEVVIVAPVAADADEGDFFDKLARRTAGGGGDRGDIDKAVRHIFTLPERQPVTGLTAEPFPRSMQPVAAVAAGNDATRRRAAATPKAVVIATTSTRIYEFVGHLGKLRGDESESESLYEKLFEPYRGDAVPNLKSELPGDLPYSELHTWTASGHREASALAWLTGPGVYHGLVSYSDQDVGDSVIDSANLLPYPAVALEGSGDGGDGSGGQTIAEIPLSIALTEFHFILLYQDRVMAISSLDDQVIFEEPLPLRPEERVIGTAVDAAKRTFWVYTDASIFELVVKDEDRDVWRIYLERGSFDASLRYAKPGIQRGTVLSSQGDRYFSEARYIQAAQCYAQTFMRSFEEIVLRFIEAGQRDALRYYLVMRLERLRRSDVPQRTMLATWLVEIYLSKINQLEDVAAAEAASQDVENYKLEREMLSEELEQFLATYQDVLDPRTTYALIQKHGRAEVLLHYARTIGDYDKIVRHYVQEEAWSRAIDTLNRQESEDLYYRFATVLMRNAPGELVECWMRRKSLEPRRLIPALLQHRPRRGERDQAIRYLRHVVSRDGNTDTAIHNLLLTLLARAAASAFAHSDDSAKAELVAFIDSAPCKPLSEQPYFDLDYALRTCAAHGQKEACVRIYVKMGRYESAVELALQQGEMELACSSAERFEGDREAKKKLWLKITREVVRNTRDIKR